MLNMAVRTPFRMLHISIKHFHSRSHTVALSCPLSLCLTHTCSLFSPKTGITKHSILRCPNKQNKYIGIHTFSQMSVEVQCSSVLSPLIKSVHTTNSIHKLKTMPIKIVANVLILSLDYFILWFFVLLPTINLFRPFEMSLHRRTTALRSLFFVIY